MDEHLVFAIVGCWIHVFRALSYRGLGFGLPCLLTALCRAVSVSMT